MLSPNNVTYTARVGYYYVPKFTVTNYIHVGTQIHVCHSDTKWATAAVTEIGEDDVQFVGFNDRVIPDINVNNNCDQLF